MPSLVITWVGGDVGDVGGLQLIAATSPLFGFNRVKPHVACSLRHRHHLKIDKLERNEFNSQAAVYSRNRDRGYAPPLIPSLMSPPGCRTRSPVFLFSFPF